MTVQKRPTKVKVLGHTVSIVWDKKLRQKGIFGHANKFDMSIHVSPDVPLSQQQSTVFHELLHILWSISGMKQRLEGAWDCPPNFVDFAEEETVRAYENSLFAIMKDNKSLLKWMSNDK